MLCPIYLSAKMCSGSGSLALEDSGYQNGELPGKHTSASLGLWL